MTARKKRHGHTTATTVSPTYQSWKGIWQRCENPNNPRFSDYGGRGIKVDPAWKDFTVFLKDMGERPIDKTLERLDNNKGYNKENCVWASLREQNLNQRIRKDNPLGIKGVTYHKTKGVFYANARVHGKLIHFYCGPDFFEACCARKSYDARL